MEWENWDRAKPRRPTPRASASAPLAPDFDAPLILRRFSFNVSAPKSQAMCISPVRRAVGRRGSSGRYPSKSKSPVRVAGSALQLQLASTYPQQDSARSHRPSLARRPSRRHARTHVLSERRHVVQRGTGTQQGETRTASRSRRQREGG
jgi:hypothetical protein